ncbi:MAG: hypothetical protein RR698_16460 [Stenotrophomonas sp.]
MELSFEDLKRAIDEPGCTADVCVALMNSWLEITRQRLGFALSAKRNEGSEIQGRVDAVGRAIHHLDPAARRRLLASPWVSAFLDDPAGTAYENQHGEPVSTLNALWLAALAECPVRQRNRTNEASRIAGADPLESALGDRVTRSEGNSAGRIERPRIGGVIVLDVDSRLSQRYEAESGTFCQPSLGIPQHEIQAIKSKLEAAIRMVDESAPHLGLLIRTFTRRVLVRKSIEAGDGVAPLNLGSEYRPTHAGCIRVLNVHREEMTVDLCAEAILHESVHSFLSAYEDVYGKFMSSAIRVRPVSPWSGNFIPNHSLVHAVFVYYAIHQLLARALDSFAGFDHAAIKRVKRRLMHIDGGFFIERKMSTLFVLEEIPSEELMALVDEVQSSIRKVDRSPEVGVVTEAAA